MLLWCIWERHCFEKYPPTLIFFFLTANGVVEISNYGHLKPFKLCLIAFIPDVHALFRFANLKIFAVSLPGWPTFSSRPSQDCLLALVPVELPHLEAGDGLNSSQQAMTQEEQWGTELLVRQWGPLVLGLPEAYFQCNGQCLFQPQP